jgi:uncharacterized peroxidase-related enzyme
VYSRIQLSEVVDTLAAAIIIGVAMPDTFIAQHIERDLLGEELISRLSVPDEATLPLSIRELFTEFRRDYGFVPNWLAALAVNPDTAYRMVVFYRHLFDPERSLLTAVDRELLAVVTSAANHCGYCVLNHTKTLGAALGDRNLALRIALGHGHVKLTERELALAETAEQLTRDPVGLNSEVLIRLRALGFSEAAIVEILEVSAFFNYANRLTVPLAVVPDKQFFSK